MTSSAGGGALDDDGQFQGAPNIAWSADTVGKWTWARALARLPSRAGAVRRCGHPNRLRRDVGRFLSVRDVDAPQEPRRDAGSGNKPGAGKKNMSSSSGSPVAASVVGDDGLPKLRQRPVPRVIVRAVVATTRPKRLTRVWKERLLQVCAIEGFTRSRPGSSSRRLGGAVRYRA